MKTNLLLWRPKSIFILLYWDKNIFKHFLNVLRFGLRLKCGNGYRDNNLGMWSRGPNSDGDGVSESGPDYTDDMSGSARVAVLPRPSPTFTLGLLCFLLSHTVIPLTVIL